jgi:hypothetical protein
MLRMFLPACTAEETNQFFGPIKYYLMEDQQPNKLLQFDNTGHGADKELIPPLPLEPTGETTVVTKTVERTWPMPQKGDTQTEGVGERVNVFVTYPVDE